MIKRFFIASAFLIITIQSFCQEIRGVVIDSENDSALGFVNIGIVDTPRGTITNRLGQFKLDCKNLHSNSVIQVSMIGYESKLIDVSDLLYDTSIIKLVKSNLEIEGVTVISNNQTKDIGTTKTSKMAGVCGWGGTDFGKGHEIGLFINLGENPVQIDNINLKIRKHSYDTVVFRMHIRSIQDNLPFVELLTQNIYLPVTRSSGWQQIDLSDYSIILSGNIALSIEWVSISNVIERNLIKMNGNKNPTPNVLFEMNNKKGTTFIRRGSADKWKRSENCSPGFYLTARE